MRVIYIKLAILAALMQSPLTVHANWLRAKTDHFIIYGDMREKAIRDFAEKLERFDTLIRFVTNNDDKDTVTPVTIFSLASENEIKRF